jgi:hypothetical protein
VSERERTYNEKIAPIMEKSCVGCHNAKKARGHFRADSLAGLVKGGEDAGEGCEEDRVIEQATHIHQVVPFRIPVGRHNKTATMMTKATAGL